jgi:hypothetical protein
MSARFYTRKLKPPIRQRWDVVRVAEARMNKSHRGIISLASQIQVVNMG